MPANDACAQRGQPAEAEEDDRRAPGRDRRQREHAEHSRDRARQRADDPRVVRALARRCLRPSRARSRPEPRRSGRRARPDASPGSEDRPAPAPADRTLTRAPARPATVRADPRRAGRGAGQAASESARVADETADRLAVFEGPAPDHAARRERRDYRCPQPGSRPLRESGPAGRRRARCRGRAAVRARAPRSRRARALVGQCTRRAGSPGAYGRTARTVSPVPAHEQRRAARGPVRRGSACNTAWATPGRGATTIGAGSLTRMLRVRTNTPSGADVRSWMRTVRKTPRRVAVCGSRPSAGAAVRHHEPGGSRARTSTRPARPDTAMRNSSGSPTVASVGAVSVTPSRDTDQIGHAMPMTNKVKANMPTATTACWPVAAPAATPYAPRVNSTIDVSVEITRSLVRGSATAQGHARATAPRRCVRRTHET